MSAFPHRRLLAWLLPILALAPSVQAQTPVLPLNPDSDPYVRNPTPEPLPLPPLKLPEATPPPKGFVAAKILRRGPVFYPTLAHLNRVEGVVRVEFSIDETGHVARAFVVRSSGSALLDAVVLEDGMKQWEFSPAMLDGKPVPSVKDEEFEFRLDPAEERAIALKRLALPVGTPDAPYPPEAIPFHLHGSATVSVTWTKGGLVDLIYLAKPSGYNVLDHAALRWAYENWHVDPATLDDQTRKQPFTKTMNFTPPTP